ncbi:MAG: hypothetical protein OYI31_00570 [Chloroflexota bacterium]|nr:hypothetical protein [Chloroflexota bacterium]MDE2940765.1 hypothetical protein [Chloroflexota bacterium]MDE3266947.1 hypothetical protein [Chloroflexota bacterium]
MSTPDSVTIVDLIRNGTMSSRMAAVLWAAVDARLSIVVVAIPRLAGKTTTFNAVLSLLPPDVPVHRLGADQTEVGRLKEAATGGYLVVPEFSRGPVPGYIWGEPVQRVFDAMTVGYSLVTSMHAPGLEETFNDICEGCGVADEDASRIDLMLYILRFGEDDETFWRRVSEIHEIDRVRDGRPEGRQLFKWVESDDRFEAVDTPVFLRGAEADVERRRAMLDELASSGRRSPEEVAQMALEFAEGSGR